MAKRYELSDEACSMVSDLFIETPWPRAPTPVRPADAQLRALGVGSARSSVHSSVKLSV
jgi:hypothetical protein